LQSIAKREGLKVRQRMFSTYLTNYLDLLLSNVKRLLEVTPSGYFNSLLLGNSADLSNSTMLQIKTTGTLYFFVISGMHVSLLRGYILKSVRWLPIPWVVKLWVSLLFLTVFGAMIGFSTPIIRVLVMQWYVFGGTILKRLSSRKYVYLLLVGFYTICTVLPTSDLTVVSASFLLSYGAVFSLYFLVPRYRIANIGEYVVSQLKTSVYVNMCIAPLLLFYFGAWNPLSIFFSVVFSPVVALLLFFGFVLLAWQTASMLVFSSANMPSLPLVSAFTVLVRAFSLLLEVGAYFPTNISYKVTFTTVLLYYLALLLVFFSRRRYFQYRATPFL